MENKQQEKAPLVSFIITCYNLSTTLLRQCIDSVMTLSMDPSEREIIVVDDGSNLNMLNDLISRVIFTLFSHLYKIICHYFEIAFE